MSDDPMPGGRGQITAPEIEVKSPALQTAKNEAPPLQNRSKPGPSGLDVGRILNRCGCQDYNSLGEGLPVIPNDKLHQFILGFGLELPNDRRLGRPADITQLWLNAKGKCLECEMSEILDALATLRSEHARLTKFVAVGGSFQPLSFERVRDTSRWKDFLMTGYFNITVLPEGRAHFQWLSEQAGRETSTGGTFAELQLSEPGLLETKAKENKGKWVWHPADHSSAG